ncbi:hypothetical protein RYX36_031139 [Vicia faba]
MRMEIKEDVEGGKKRGVRESLLGENNKQLVNETNHHDHPWMVYFTTFIAVGYSSPTQDAIRKDLNLSLAEVSKLKHRKLFIKSWFWNIYMQAMRVSSAFCIAGWLVIYFSKGPVPLDVGRLATGYGMGVFSFVVPVFIAEIAPKERRGVLTTLNQFMIVIGGSASFILGTILSWRDLSIIGLIPTAVLLFGLFFIPESPRWLARRGRTEDFVATLQILRGKDADISQEAAEIQDYITSLELLAKPKMLDLFQRRYLRSLTIGVGLMVCQQFGGINGVGFYASSVFDLAGFPSATGSILFAILQIVVTGVGAALVDKVGRKPLLVVSGSGLVTGSILTAVAFYLKVHDVCVGAVPALALAGLLVYIGSFAIGMGAVPWVVMSEIFPVNIKGQAGSIATLVNWFGAWLCSYTFNFLMSWSSYGTFILYAAINVLAILFIVVVVPETKVKMEMKEDVEGGKQRGVREALLGENNKQLVHQTKHHNHPWMVYFTTFIAVCGSFEFGTCCGYSSPTQEAIRKDLNLSLAEGPVSLDIGRLATGYGMGVFSFVFMVVTGASTAFVIGTILPWRALTLVGLIPNAVLLLGLFFIPESPRWLAKRGRTEDFVAALQILRGKDYDISHEAEEIQDYITTLEKLSKPKVLDLFQKRYLRSLMIGIGLMICQQFGGINGVVFYASSIFDLAGFPSTAGSIYFAICQIVITGVGATLIDKAGRKPLLLASGSGMIAGCIFMAVAFYLKVHDVGVGEVPALAVTGILVYAGSFSIGMGAVPWVVMSEIFPVNIKGQAGSIATLVNWFGAWLCSYTFNFLMSWSLYGTFILYGWVNAVAILFIVLVVPETKGKSLEQLQAAINV